MAQFYLPTRIIAGLGCFSELGLQAAPLGGRAILVCGARSLRASGNLDRALSALRDAEVEPIVYDAVSGEPTLEMVQAGLDLARQRSVELAIGIGGGSAMDVAKAIAGLYRQPGTVDETFAGARPLAGDGLPWIAVPTTAGTGAEVTKNAVLTSPTHGKSSLRHDSWFASIALVDPELTLSAPPEVTAASGSDALTQAIESYTSIGASPVTDALSTDAIARIGRALPRAVADGGDLDARADMLYGSMLAGMALANARLGGVHGMAHPLGHRYHIPHGVVCGLLLPYTMEYNVEHAVAKYACVAHLLGVDTRGMDAATAAERAVERAREIVLSVGIPTHLAPYGVRDADLEAIALESLPSGSLKHNPRPLAAEDVVAILRAAL
ncbi:MAG: iron-containing alcohol dehydrogenase [Anaerolineae bacterium]|nr:iron-containing alcohol dehydrogenase [Anaerolineae bacterium]